MRLSTNHPKRPNKKMERNVQSKRRRNDSPTKNKHARLRPSIPRPSHVQNLRPNTPKNKKQIPSIPIDGILLGNRRPHLRRHPRSQGNRPPHVNKSPKLHQRNLQLAKPRINLQRKIRNRRNNNLKIKRNPKNKIRRIHRLERPSTLVPPIPKRPRHPTKSNKRIHPRPRNAKNKHHSPSRIPLHPKQKTPRKRTQILLRRKPTKNHNLRMPRTNRRNPTPPKQRPRLKKIPNNPKLPNPKNRLRPNAKRRLPTHAPLNFKSENIGILKPRTFSFLSKNPLPKTNESGLRTQDSRPLKYLHWLSVDQPNIKVEIRMPDGLITTGLGEPKLSELKIGTTIQFERFGFVTLHKKHKNKLEFWFTHN